MRVKGATIQNVLLGLALLLGVLWNLAYAGEIKDLRVVAGATGTRAEIRLDGAGDYQLISLSNPDRLVVDLPGASLARDAAMPQGVGLVKSVRKGQPVPGTTRIVFDLAHGGHAGPLKPQIKTTDPRKQAAKRHRHQSSPRSISRTQHRPSGRPRLRFASW